MFTPGGNNSVVECDLAKVEVAGSNPVSRSNFPRRIFYFFLAASAVTIVVSAQSGFSPPRYIAGSAPSLPAMVVGGGEVLLEATIDTQGRVETTKVLRTTPPFADLLTDAVRGWRFDPARELVSEDARPGAGASWSAIDSKVLVAGVFRAPTLNAPTHGERPRDLFRPSADVAAPLANAEPPYPPDALSGGVVLLEAHIGADGAVGAIVVLQSAPPFDGPAQTALRSWTFRPARVSARPVPTFVYVVFGFPSPITQAPGR